MLLPWYVNPTGHFSCILGLFCRYIRSLLTHLSIPQICDAAHIIEFMGSNITTLRCMNLRDYLLLKVEIEGTSGEGSSQVNELN